MNILKQYLLHLRYRKLRSLVRRRSQALKREIRLVTYYDEPHDTTVKLIKVGNYTFMQLLPGDSIDIPSFLRWLRILNRHYVLY